jgi:hypothetical protein
MDHPARENSCPFLNCAYHEAMSRINSAAPANRMGAIPLFRRAPDDDEEEDEKPAHDEDEDDEDEGDDEPGDDGGDGYSE